MRIIQDNSRWDNLRKLHEMQTFFEDEGNELRDTYRSQSLYKRMTLIGFLLITMACTWRVVAGNTLLGITEEIILRVRELCFIGSATVIYGLFRLLKSLQSDIMCRYSEQDMVLYWLLEEVYIRDIEVSKTRKKAIFHTGYGDIKVRLDGYKVDGEGISVEAVDLDNKVIYVC